MPSNKHALRSTKKLAKNKRRAQCQRTDAGAAANAEDAATQRNRVVAEQQNGIAAGSRAMGQQQQQTPSTNFRSMGAVSRACEQGVWQGARAARDAAAAAIAAAALAAAGAAAGSAPAAAGLTPVAIAAGHACESARLRAQGRLRELFTGSSSALKIALIARGAAAQKKNSLPAPAPRTPEPVTETRYKAAPATRSAPGDVDLLDLADDEWQGDDGEDSDKDELLAKFRRLQVSPLERLPMEIAAGEAPYKRRRHRTDADLRGLALSVRCRIGPPGSDRAAEEHISYAAFMEACPPRSGVIPGHNATPKNKNGPDINERRRQQRLARVRKERAAAFAAARAKAGEAAAAAATAGTAATTAAGDGVIESLVMTLTPSAPRVPPPPAVVDPATAAALADDADADPADADTN